MMNVKNLLAACFISIGTMMTGAALAAPVLVYSTDFDVALPAEISPGSATLTGVQGYAGLGPVGNQFGGNFLRSATGNTVMLTLNGLPAHDTISLSFLFAAIDSLDGTGSFPAGDFFKIVFDGNTLFSESFANADPSQIQSYVPPAGVQLARHSNLGFSGPGGFYTDSAYNFGADPTFANFAHTASSVTIEFFIFGVGNQSLDDESWAMDNLRVSVTTRAGQVPEPASGLLLLIAAAGMLAVSFVRRKV
jgi:hypothetical protein